MISDPNEYRLSLARKLGADIVLNPNGSSASGVRPAGDGR